MRRVLLELCDAAAGITRAAGAVLVILLCATRTAHPSIAQAIVH